MGILFQFLVAFGVVYVLGYFIQSRKKKKQDQ
jgi:hypothetical protein